MSSAEKTGWSGWASFCESVSASMAAPEVLSESTTEEFTNTLASWLRFCSLSLLELLLFFRHNTTQQTTTTGEPSWKSGSSTSSCYCSLSRACKVLSWLATLSRGKLLASAPERSLCSLGQFSNDYLDVVVGCSSQHTQKETFPLLMYFFCVVFFVVVVFRLSTPRDRQINEIFPFSTKFF